MDDLTFYVEKDGENIKCDIVSMIKGENDNETYVAFTDYKEKDGKGYLQYAKIVKLEDGNYSIEKFDDEQILEELKNKVNDDISTYIYDKLESAYE